MGGRRAEGLHGLMPVLENHIQLGDLNHSIDWQKASRSIRALRGRVVVEMLPVPEKVGVILLPDTNKNIRPDVGVVVANQGGGVCIKNRAVRYPKLGTLVCVRPYDGTWLEDADCGGYKPQGQIRAYGTYAEYDEPQRCNWWDSVVCEVEAETMTFRPYGDKIIFRLDPIQATEGGIILTFEAQYRTGMATIEQVGPLVFDVKPGDRVCVNLNHLTESGLKIDVEDKDLAIGTELAIEYVLTEAA